MGSPEGDAVRGCRQETGRRWQSRKTLALAREVLDQASAQQRRYPVPLHQARADDTHEITPTPRTLAPSAPNPTSGGTVRHPATIRAATESAAVKPVDPSQRDAYRRIRIGASATLHEVDASDLQSGSRRGEGLGRLGLSPPATIASGSVR